MTNSLKTVRARVAIAVDDTGEWAVAGYPNTSDEAALNEATDMLDSGANTFMLEIELPVPSGQLEVHTGELLKARGDVAYVNWPDGTVSIIERQAVEAQGNTQTPTESFKTLNANGVSGVVYGGCGFRVPVVTLQPPAPPTIQASCSLVSPEAPNGESEEPKASGIDWHILTGGSWAPR